MIKINLLGVAPAPSKTPSGGGPPVSIVTQGVVFLGALIIFFGIVGVLYKVWDSEHDRLSAELSNERRRQQELEQVKAQNAQYQQHLQDLEARINTIHLLQASRVGPVELMNSLGGVVNQTNDVFLYTMTPMGEREQLKGESGTVNSMAKFLASLKKSGAFSDVQLEQFYEDDQHDHLTYKFTVSCQFISPTTGTTPAAAVGAPAAPAMGPAGQPGGLPNVPAQIQQAPKRAL
jgi:Tfp pilus assembly protein PilN